MAAVDERFGVGGGESHLRMLRQSGGYFNLREVLQGDFDVAASEFAVGNLENIRLRVVHADGLAWQREHVSYVRR